MSKNQEDFLQIIETNKGIIYKIANAYSKNIADRNDLSQEIILQLWQSFNKYNKQYKFSTWMYRIALNTAISFYRKFRNKRTFDFPVSEEIFQIKDEALNIEKEANLIMLEKFISELDELDKALTLLYLDEKTQKEIAGILGLTETNISTKIARIKNKLRARFNQENK